MVGLGKQIGVGFGSRPGLSLGLPTCMSAHSVFFFSKVVAFETFSSPQTVSRQSVP